MAQIVSVQFYKGEDVSLNFSPLLGPTSIGSWTLLLNVKARDIDAVALLSVAGVITSATLGTFSVTLTSAQTQSLGSGIFFFDVWRTDIAANSALVVGRMSVLADPRFGG